MKSKIQKFSKGNFRQEKPEVLFDETNLVLIIGEGEIYKGSFEISSENGSAIRGIIYPSSFRVKLKEQGFDGNPCRIYYSYDGIGLRPGDVERSKLTIVCTGGEYELSLTAIIEKPYFMTNYGKVQNTEEFRKLAMKDFAEAARFFKSKSFYNILKYEDNRIFHLYDNMRKWSLEEQDMEEFLVGIKKKECIFLTLPGEGMLFEDILQQTKATVSLMKNTWGYVPIMIGVDGDFLHVPKKELTTEDFVGNTYEVEYFVKPSHLHGGRNYGKLFFITPYETLSYDVEVLQNQDYNDNHHMTELLLAQGTKEYVGYMAGRISLDSWMDSAIEKLVSIRKIDSQNEIYQLLQAHVYAVGHKIEEAKWLLENYNYSRFATGKDPVTNCYYLFLTALIRNNKTYTDRVLDEIGKTYVRHQDSWELLYMLLHMDQRYKSPSKRLGAIEEQFSFGINSVLFYMEACMCYKESPGLLRKLGNFEVQVLNFASKYRLITEEMSMYVVNLATQQKKFSDKIFRILERMYECEAKEEILYAICTLLIKGNKTESGYFVWYERAVIKELRIARLYEYFMFSVSENRYRGALPRTIYLYFMHGHSLDYKKTAFLYANIIKHNNEEDIFLGYREQIVSFTWSELLKRHISEHLRILYKRFCVSDEMTPERMEAMRDICFSYEITTKVPNMKCVLVIEKDGSVNQRVPYKEGEGAIVYLYDKESRIVWESMGGRYYTDSIVFGAKRLFYEPVFIELCKKYGDISGVWDTEPGEEEISYDDLKNGGIPKGKEKRAFQLCVSKIREQEYEEDSLLVNLCYELFSRGFFDKTTLMYMSNYFCGATSDMRRIWKEAKENGIQVYKLGERIITQMLFSENLLMEEHIFEDYYMSDNAYFRLKQAYLACAAREYLLRDRKTEGCIFHMIALECEKKEELPDVCKLAMLTYYAYSDERVNVENILHKVLREMCEKQIVLPVFMSYNPEWLREAQIYDKTLISYKSKSRSKVKLHYKLKQGTLESLGYETEVLVPVFENIYVKQFILFNDETIVYYIQEDDGREMLETDRMIVDNRGTILEGKYGKLSRMTNMLPAARRKAMIDYKEEILLAEELFRV